MNGEFDLIARIRARAGSGPGVVLGIGDDAAVLQPDPEMQLVVTTDNLVEGRHFDARAGASDIGHLALAVNLSDLAAMGANPRWCLLALTLPEGDPVWLEGFLDGFLELAAEHHCALVGGNLARGTLNIAVTLIGQVRHQQFITRSGARPGDRIIVTGTLGDAAAALDSDAPADSFLAQRLRRPQPRLTAGQELASMAHTMIDISDGLSADLQHLLGPGLGARLELEHLPASDTLVRILPDQERRWKMQLKRGSDYELLACLPAQASLPPRIGDTAIHEIGVITESGRIECIRPDGNLFEFQSGGWDHFPE